MTVVDIYEKYNLVTDWDVLKASVDGAYVKGSDGGGPPSVSAFNYVRQCLARDIPVGVYHFAQKTPSARIQANVLSERVYSLHSLRLPPALDLEDSEQSGVWSANAAREFTLEFTDQLRVNGFHDVTVYGNRSMLDRMKIDQWLQPWMYVWLAEYGPNDGDWHKPKYTRTRVDLHQYTSTGNCGGIRGWVDLNLLNNPSMILGANTVELADKIRMWDGKEITVGQALGETWQLANNVCDKATREGQPADPPPWVGEIHALRAEVSRIADVLDTLVTGGFRLGATGEIVVKPTPVVEE